MVETKSYNISKQLVKDAYERVKKNRGTFGVDEQSIDMFEQDLKKNLYKIWNRMSSGSYIPPAVREVEIPKNNGGKRKLGIPTVGDRVAQMVAKLYLEPNLEKVFHKNSYGYRPRRSAINALSKCKERSWQYDWIIDLDIKGFFDNIDHELMLKALDKHCPYKWVRLYVERWLKVEVENTKGETAKREKGTPQGGVISPLLANLYLHYTFDKWMEINHPDKPFERYADDIIIHCKSEQAAQNLLREIRERLEVCKLELNEEKSKIVYCKDCIRKQEYKHTKFDFLGYQFRPRFSRSLKGHYYVGFTPAISPTATSKITRTMRSWKLHTWSGHSIEEVAKGINATLRGWINYYGHYNKSNLYRIFKHLDYRLIKWCMKKYKGIGKKKAVVWWKKLKEINKSLFAHWSLSYA